MADSLLRWRGEFPILETCTYLISNSLGAMPRGVYDSLRAYADTWAALGVSAWGKPYADRPTWWALNGAVGDTIAPLIGAPPGSVLIHQNANRAIIVSTCMTRQPRKETV
jgi:kynureninase